MTEDVMPDKATPPAGQAQDEDAVAQLLLRAGRRPEIPADYAEQVHRAGLERWQQVVAAERQRSRFRRALISGGGVLAAALALISVRFDLLETPWLGGAEAVGPVAVLDATAGGEIGTSEGSLAVGAELPAGAVIDTSAQGLGRAVLRLTSGVWVRLDIETRVSLISARELELERGAVYIDTDAAAPTLDGRPQIQVHTALGTASDIGTRFEVRWLDVAANTPEAVRIRVRDGDVTLDAPGLEAPTAAGPGVELELRAGGALERGRLDDAESPWAWSQELLPTYDAEGRSLLELLQWLSHEADWQLAFAELRLRDAASSATLHGNVGGLSLTEALELSMLGSGLEYQLDGDTLRIQSADS